MFRGKIPPKLTELLRLLYFSTTGIMQSVPAKLFFKSVDIRRTYGHKFGGVSLFWLTVDMWCWEWDLLRTKPSFETATGAESDAGVRWYEPPDVVPLSGTRRI